MILDKVMDTPAISIFNVERGIRLSALMKCMKGGEKEKPKDISQVTFGEFLNKLTEISAKPPFEMELSFVRDWEYFRGKSDIWKELTGLNYNLLIETVSQLFKTEEMRKWFREVVTGCYITRDMMVDKEKTLESYYEVVADLMRKANDVAPLSS